MEQRGDAPTVDQITETDINGQPATRVMGHYVGAIGDMGYQQYLRYVIKKGDMFYIFTLYAVDALGVSSSMMTDILPLRENDITLFEKMMATMKFKE
jgi:tetrahydromethanopterin S-methyltransferase subunit C